MEPTKDTGAGVSRPSEGEKLIPETGPKYMYQRTPGGHLCIFRYEQNGLVRRGTKILEVSNWQEETEIASFTVAALNARHKFLTKINNDTSINQL
jgi:hypothetical protein